jgi:hypothetical protein
MSAFVETLSHGCWWKTSFRFTFNIWEVLAATFIRTELRFSIEVSICSEFLLVWLKSSILSKNRGHIRNNCFKIMQYVHFSISHKGHSIK